MEQQLSSVVFRPRGVFKVKTISQQCYEGYVPSYQSWDTDWQWKSNGWSRTLSPNLGSGVMLHGGHPLSPEACSQKKPICLTNVLQEAVTVIPITSSPLVHNLWRTGSAPETLPLYTRHTAYLQKSTCAYVSFGRETRLFSMKLQIFTEKPTNYSYSNWGRHLLKNE